MAPTGLLTASSLPIIRGPPTRIVGGSSKDVVRGPKGLVKVGGIAKSSWYEEAIIRGTKSICRVPDLEGDCQWRLTPDAREELFRPKPIEEAPKNDQKDLKVRLSPIPPAPDSQPPSGAIKVGSRVVVKDMPNHNGQEGVIVSWVSDMQRWEVRLGGTTLKLKPENVDVKEETSAAEGKETHKDRLVRRNTEKDLIATPPDFPNANIEIPEHIPSERPSKAYEWIRFNNQEHARARRRDIAEMTRQASLAGGYKMAGGKVVRLNRVKQMLEGTKFIAPNLGTFEAPKSSGVYSDTKVRGMHALTLDAALKLRDEHRNGVGAVSAASSYHCGGGFETGGRHALEEAICIQTTAFVSLSKMEHEVLAAMDRSHGGFGEYLAYIPSDGVVLSPFVEIFREGSDKGYRFMKEPAQLAALISLGMYNKNGGMSDCPVDAPAKPADYKEGVKRKFRSMFAAAVKAKCAALVVPDVGCGVYQNDPGEVGICLGEVLREEFWCHLREVVVVGKREFQDAAMKTCEEIGKRLDKELAKLSPPPIEYGNQSAPMPPSEIRGSSRQSRQGAGVGLDRLATPSPPPQRSASRPSSGLPSRPPAPLPSPPVTFANKSAPSGSQSPRETVGKAYTTQQANGWPNVVMKGETGTVKIPNGELVQVLGESGPADYEILWGTQRGTVKRANLQEGTPDQVLPGQVLSPERGRHHGRGNEHSNEGGRSVSPRPEREDRRSFSPPPERASLQTPPFTMERPMCRYHCGRRAAPGTTKSGKPLDTCCKTCGRTKGKGGHDAHCDG